jgi:putative oxidoreductase
MKAGSPQNYALMILRITVAGLILAHGIARIYLGGVDDFGIFLTSKGFPIGFYIAWVITVFEIAGSVSLIIGRYILPLSIIFAAHLFAGILLVHLKEGWFVVGAGRNGAEYSVLLIAVFITLAVAHFDKAK